MGYQNGNQGHAEWGYFWKRNKWDVGIAPIFEDEETDWHWTLSLTPRSMSGAKFPVTVHASNETLGTTESYGQSIAYLWPAEKEKNVLTFAVMKLRIF